MRLCLHSSGTLETFLTVLCYPVLAMPPASHASQVLLKFALVSGLAPTELMSTEQREGGDVLLTPQLAVSSGPMAETLISTLLALTLGCGAGT